MPEDKEPGQPLSESEYQEVKLAVLQKVGLIPAKTVKQLSPKEYAQLLVDIEDTQAYINKQPPGELRKHQQFCLDMIKAQAAKYIKKGS